MPETTNLAGYRFIKRMKAAVERMKQMESVCLDIQKQMADTIQLNKQLQRAVAIYRLPPASSSIN